MLKQRSGEEVVHHVDVWLGHHWLWRYESRSDLGVLLLFHPGLLSLGGFFVQEGFDADASGFRAEVSAQSVGACEPAATTPLRVGLQTALTDEFLLTGMKTFVAFTVVLTSERFAADGAYERSLVGVRAQMGAEVVRSSESLRTEIALKRGGVLLLPAALCAVGRCSLGIGEIEDVVSLIGCVAGATVAGAKRAIAASCR